MPFAFPNVSISQHWKILRPRLDSLVENVPTSVFVVLAPLNDLAPDISDRNPGVVFEILPSIIGTLVLLVASGREGVDLS